MYRIDIDKFTSNLNVCVADDQVDSHYFISSCFWIVLPVCPFGIEGINRPLPRQVRGVNNWTLESRKAIKYHL